MAITKAKVQDLEQSLSSAAATSGDVSAADDSVADEEAEEGAPRRRKGLVPLLESGDLDLLRLLAVWRFAGPVALGALAWPTRTPAGREWRMRRLVDCGILGRRRLRFATTRHVVWARSRATQLALSPPPPNPLVPPRWNEDAARHGWVRSAVTAAYWAAGWNNTKREDLERLPTIIHLPPEYAARVFSKTAPSFPFEIFFRKRKTTGKFIFHIVVVDDRQTAIDRILDLLPVQADRSSRIAVRFFPCDDFTIWSPKEKRYVFEEARVLRMHESLRNAGLLDIPPENAGPAVTPWRSLK